MDNESGDDDIIYRFTTGLAESDEFLCLSYQLVRNTTDSIYFRMAVH